MKRSNNTKRLAIVTVAAAIIAGLSYVYTRGAAPEDCSFWSCPAYALLDGVTSLFGSLACLGTLLLAGGWVYKHYIQPR